MEMDKMDTPLSIRSISSVEELIMVRDLEKVIWESDDPVPIHQTVTAVKNGGVMIGAFVGERLIGFQYSFSGFDGKRAYLCSHAMGLHPDFRVSGIGEKLKLAQRLEAIGKGYDLITWTYDPLETINGNLNIKKLGATCSQYIENCYGDMTDILNVGVSSDRFQVEWKITSDRVISNLENYRMKQHHYTDASQLIHVELDEQGFPIPLNVDVSLDQVDGTLLVAVPSAFQKIKEHDLNKAIHWRMQTRGIFSHYFRKGWEVVDFIKNDATASVHYYVLQKM